MIGWSNRRLVRRLSERGQALAASTVVKGCFPCSTVVTDPQSYPEHIQGLHGSSRKLS